MPKVMFLVVDAETDMPIEGARIALFQQPFTNDMHQKTYLNDITDKHGVLSKNIELQNVKLHKTEGLGENVLLRCRCYDDKTGIGYYTFEKELYIHYKFGAGMTIELNRDILLTPSKYNSWLQRFKRNFKQMFSSI